MGDIIHQNTINSLKFTKLLRLLIKPENHCTSQKTNTDKIDWQTKTIELSYVQAQDALH